MGESNLSDIYDLLGNLAYTIIFLSFLVRNMLWLRSLAIVASFASIAYNTFAPAEPLMIPIYWNLAFILTNGIQIGIIYYEKRTYFFEGHEAYLKDNFFPDLSCGEFRSLLSAGELRAGKKGDLLIEEDEAVKELIFLFEGEVSITSNGAHIKTIGKSHFLGEMSFLTGNHSRGTVIVASRSLYFAWDMEKLKELTERKPMLGRSFQRALSHQLIDYILDDKQKSQCRLKLVS